MIRIQRLYVRYGDCPILHDINLEITPGEFVLITGPSGCGKSTLARCLSGLIPHSIAATMTGQVLVDGRATTELSVPDLATTIGLVFQNPSTQLFNLSVDEEIAFGPRNLGWSEERIKERGDWALAATGISHLRGRQIRTLSGGEQQRLAIASVLAMGSRILILDEPTSSLDIQGVRDVMQALSGLNVESGITIVLIEHRLAEVARLAKRTIIMDEGRIVADGTTQEIFNRHDLLRRLGLRRPAEEVKEDWVSLLDPNGHSAAPPIVEMKGVEVGYGSRTVLKGLDLTLHAGEFAALVGTNGAGKSTLARVLAGLVKPRRGEVRLSNGRSLVPGRGVGLLFQNPMHQLFCDTVGEEVAFGPRNFACLQQAELEAVLSATDLLAVRHQPIQCLSSGQQQRTALAAVLALKPQVLILDEPTVGQDWRHLSSFMDFLITLNQTGSTILLITHDYKLVHRYAQRILLLREGRIAVDGVPTGREDSRRRESAYAIHHS